MARYYASTNNTNWGMFYDVTEGSYSIENNTSPVGVNVYLYRPASASYYGGTANISFTLNGETKSTSAYPSYPTNIGVGEANAHLMASFSYTVPHNNDGSKTISFSLSWSANFSPTSASGSDTMVLTTIPRYFTQTPKLELVSKTTKTITLKWTTSENASRSQYSVGDASHWVDVETGINKKTGTMTISGLTANTSYRIYGDFMRADSSLWCQTKPYIDVATYDYAKLVSAPNFNDENNPTITYTNPLGNVATTLQACIANTDGTGIGISYRNINKTGTLSYTFNFTEAERNSLRTAATSNSKKVKFYIKTAVDNTTYYSEKEATLTIVNGNPTFSDFTYADTNSTVSNLIGTDQALVKGKSSLQVTISSANKMVANKQASPKNYTFEFGNITKQADYSTNNVTVNMGLINTAGTQKLTVRAFDSRNNLTPVEKNIVVYEYAEPVINATVKRLNNFENQTTLSVSGEYSKLIVNNVAKNTVSSFRYRYKETGSSNWEDWADITTTVSDGNYTCDNVYLSLDNTKSFNFEIEVKDELSTVTLPLTLDVGQAIFFISSNLRECFVDGDLEVDGTVIINKQSSFANLDNFKSFCVYNAPVGISFWTLNINGAVSVAILQKANSNYLSFIHFSYGVNMTQYKYSNGTWS